MQVQLTPSVVVVAYQSGGDPDAFRRLEGQRKVSAFLVRCQRVVRYPIGEVRVKEGAESQTVVPRTAEIRYIDVSVTDRLGLAPFQESVAFRAAVFH